MKIFNKFKIAFLSKAYVEGIYADTPANRKLGRVGMSYAEYAAKQKGQEKKPIEQKEEEKSTKSENKEDKPKKSFTIGQIKEKVQDEIKKLRKKNDYVTISDSQKNTYRFSYNKSSDKESKGFNECLVKDESGKVLKLFKFSHEEDLMNSTYKYIQNLGVDITSSESGGSSDTEEVSSEYNISAIKEKMQEAKDKQTGTILVKGSGDKLIYLNRERKGRWLKDFNSYTIRDSRKNIISQGKVSSEEEFVKKLSDDLSKNNIKLEISKK